MFLFNSANKILTNYNISDFLADLLKFKLWKMRLSNSKSANRHSNNQLSPIEFSDNNYNNINYLQKSEKKLDFFKNQQEDHQINPLNFSGRDIQNSLSANMVGYDFKGKKAIKKTFEKLMKITNKSSEEEIKGKKTFFKFF